MRGPGLRVSLAKCTSVQNGVMSTACFLDRDGAVADLHVVDAERRSLVREARPRQHLVGGREAPHADLVGDRRRQARERTRRDAGEATHRRHQIVVRLVCLVQHQGGRDCSGRATARG